MITPDPETRRLEAEAAAGIAVDNAAAWERLTSGKGEADTLLLASTPRDTAAGWDLFLKALERQPSVLAPIPGSKLDA